jgi:cytochrome oxidase Cu insertion factor (SCO1/SenC/PrrC family)
MIAATAERRPEARSLALLVAALLQVGCWDDATRPEIAPKPIATAAVAGVGANESVPACCKADDAPAAADPPALALGKPRPIAIPDVSVLDQDGREVRFFSDLVKDKVVAINFVFTSCKASCPLLGAGFARLRERLGDRLGGDCALISVSVDPTVDRPERLKEWAGRFGAGAGWTLVTSPEGRKSEIDTLLKALQVFSPDKADHSQGVLVVDGSTLLGRSSRRLPAPDDLAAMLADVLRARGGRRYFTDTTLVDQSGIPRRFYSDLVAGRVVVINPFFTSCKGSCPVMAASMAKLQNRLGDRLGKDVVMISLTVDPATDTAAALAEYATRVGARPGWYFLTGDPGDLARVQSRLGQHVENREAHTSVMIVGNEATGLWMKHRDPADAAGLVAKVEEALADVPEATPAGR